MAEVTTRPGWIEQIEAALGEDPMRFLRVTDTSPMLVKARIKGIDEIDTARCWLYVEERLGWNRDPVIEALERRIEDLEEYGERPGRTTKSDYTRPEKPDWVFIERELDDDRELVEVGRHAPEEWRKKSATSKLTRMRMDSDE